MVYWETRYGGTRITQKVVREYVCCVDFADDRGISGIFA